LKPCDQNIVRTIRLSQEMMRLADQGDAEREDTGCGVLYGVLRDAAYKILQLAEEEKRRHQAKGWWPKHCPMPGCFETHCQHQDKQTTREKKEE
jgi:hypothetical protein